MRHASAGSSPSELRTPETILIARERAAFRQAALDQALAAVTADYLRLILHARYMLGWTWPQIAAEFRIDESTALRAHSRALEIMRRQLAARGIDKLSAIL